MNHHAAHRYILAPTSLIDLRISVSPSKVGAPHQHQKTRCRRTSWVYLTITLLQIVMLGSADLVLHCAIATR
jgi:hypothetical protein